MSPLNISRLDEGADNESHDLWERTADKRAPLNQNRTPSILSASINQCSPSFLSKRDNGDVIPLRFHGSAMRENNAEICGSETDLDSDIGSASNFGSFADHNEGGDIDFDVGDEDLLDGFADASGMQSRLAVNQLTDRLKNRLQGCNN